MELRKVASENIEQGHILLPCTEWGGKVVARGKIVAGRLGRDELGGDGPVRDKLQRDRTSLLLPVHLVVLERRRRGWLVAQVSVWRTIKKPGT